MATNWRNTRDYRIWRAAVIRRDVRCAVCNSLQKRTAHHKNSGLYFPEDRYNVDSGVCLCSSCHTRFHIDYKRSFREKCTEYDYNNFMGLVVYLKGLCAREDADG